jgi:hypothetical protein
MSAIPPLSGGKPTSGEPAAAAAFDPWPTRVLVAVLELDRCRLLY